MKYYLLIISLALVFSGCAQKDAQGHSTPESFSATGFFGRTGGDVVNNRP